MTPPVVPRKRSAAGKVALLILLLIIGGCVALFIQSLPPDPAKTASVGYARLRVVVDKDSYDYGYLKGVGTVENIGERGAYNPSLKVRVSKDGALLAEDTSWPAGTMLKTLNPGDKAAFESITRIPGEPGSRGITYEVSVNSFPFEVKYPK